MILSTGYGKSACFQSCLFLYDKLNPSGAPSIVVVVTPFTAIMKTQVSSYPFFVSSRQLLLFTSLKQVDFLSRQGIKACYITADQKDCKVRDGVDLGHYQFVYFGRRWQKVLLNDIYSKHLRAFVIDEARTVIKW